MITSIIAAISSNGIIGNKGLIPWNSKEDMKFFKEKTLNHPVIMGRKTYDSLRFKPLPKRSNFVVTRNESLYALQPENDFEGPYYVDSLATAIDMIEGHTNECFIIGGCEIYKEALDNDLVDRMYLNYMNGFHEGDTYFPFFDKNLWLEEKSPIQYIDFKSSVFVRKQV
jgi:dihydrofolate reductase